MFIVQYPKLKPAVEMHFTLLCTLKPNFNLYVFNLQEDEHFGYLRNWQTFVQVTHGPC